MESSGGQRRVLTRPATGAFAISTTASLPDQFSIIEGTPGSAFCPGVGPYPLLSVRVVFVRRGPILPETGPAAIPPAIASGGHSRNAAPACQAYPRCV